MRLSSEERLVIPTGSSLPGHPYRVTLTESHRLSHTDWVTPTGSHRLSHTDRVRPPDFNTNRFYFLFKINERKKPVIISKIKKSF